ncbi:MAG: lamin tail domain-containing protein, partial [Candidatus Nealsonbacteria bacterium]|nr:lamin tail domain-containing protein [Candidatus Nealsonbacteria bacterium]
WYLSDDWGWDPTFATGNYKRFRIPEKVPNSGEYLLGPGEYVVFDENHFNPTPLDPLPQHFSFNAAHGDDVWLMRADRDGNLTHFVGHAEFGAQANGKSWGRWPDPTGPLYPMTQWTSGAPNSGPRLGSVVISELHYNPGSMSGSDDLEFIEIYNRSAIQADLTRWKLRGGIDFDFADGTTLDAGATLVILPFDPVAEPDLLAAFLSHHNATQPITTTGPYSGQLENNGERVQLRYPDEPPTDEPDYYPGLLEDEVVYNNTSPWPISADGLGDSLHRRSIAAWGDDATNWIAAATTPGVASFDTVVLGRHIFYNRSFFDDNDPTANADDHAAIATDKLPLLPGEVATSANYTSYNRGINGVMVDLANLPAEKTPAAADFLFHVGNDDMPGDWPVAPSPSSVTFTAGAGTGGSDRVTIIWPDNTIRNTWLQVTVLAAHLDLPHDDVFYFGNAMADSGNSPADARVTTADLLLARNNPRDSISSPADIAFPYDYDRDGQVNAIDVLLARNNQTNFLNALELIDLPGEEQVQEAPPSGLSEAVAEPQETPLTDLAWLCDQATARQRAAQKSNSTEESVDKLLASYWP